MDLFWCSRSHCSMSISSYTISDEIGLASISEIRDCWWLNLPNDMSKTAVFWPERGCGPGQRAPVPSFASGDAVGSRDPIWERRPFSTTDATPAFSSENEVFRSLNWSWMVMKCDTMWYTFPRYPKYGPNFIQPSDWWRGVVAGAAFQVSSVAIEMGPLEGALSLNWT